MSLHDKLTIYCPNNKRLQKGLELQGYLKHVISFDTNDFFKKFTINVIKYLDRLSKPKLIDECLNFWFLYLLKHHSLWVSDHDYYQTIVQFFTEKGVFKYEPVYRPLKNKKRYIALVYKNNKFFFIETFHSLVEMQQYFQMRIKIEKRRYLIKFS
tara:strand:+ start:512 stop:976 length:465 start_codon:yes stop_codon:yes gene_type:complete